MNDVPPEGALLANIMRAKAAHRDMVDDLRAHHPARHLSVRQLEEESQALDLQGRGREAHGDAPGATLHYREAYKLAVLAYARDESVMSDVAGGALLSMIGMVAGNDPVEGSTVRRTAEREVLASYAWAYGMKAEGDALLGYVHQHIREMEYGHLPMPEPDGPAFERE